MSHSTTVVAAFLQAPRPREDAEPMPIKQPVHAWPIVAVTAAGWLVGAAGPVVAQAAAPEGTILRELLSAGGFGVALAVVLVIHFRETKYARGEARRLSNDHAKERARLLSVNEKQSSELVALRENVAALCRVNGVTPKRPEKPADKPSREVPRAPEPEDA